MYRLMVVEDEEMIRKGIVNSISWEELGYTVVAEGKNGKEALDILEKNPVDVLLTDIKIPIMDGTELAKRARKMYPDIEIVILSGFSDFEYARQAISFRAFDYFLKPTNKKKLLGVFEKLKEHMDQKRERKEDVFHNSIFINAGYEIMRQEFIEAILKGDAHFFKDFEEHTRTLELDFSGQYYTVATLKFDRKSIYQELESSWATDKRLLTFSYGNIIKEALSEYATVHYHVDDYDTINFIFCFESYEEQDNFMIPCLENISENIQNCLFKHTAIPYAIGIGLSYPSIHYISKSYVQAQKSIRRNFYLDEQKIQVYKDNNASTYEQNFINYYPDELKSAVTLIGNGLYTETRQTLETMFKRLEAQKLLPEIVKNYCVALILMIQSSINIPSEELEETIGTEYNEFVKEALTVKELETHVIQAMVKLAKKMSQVVEQEDIDEQHVTIDQAKQFMQDHLSEKINLKDISEHVYLSETYFSFFFKKVTGMTYIDYIQKLRMNKAKEILLETNCKIYEVAEQIGYNDYKYFSAQFKKYVAMTPKEYRKKNRKN